MYQYEAKGLLCFHAGLSQTELLCRDIRCRTFSEVIALQFSRNFTACLKHCALIPHGRLDNRIVRLAMPSVCHSSFSKMSTMACGILWCYSMWFIDGDISRSIRQLLLQNRRVNSLSSCLCKDT